MGKGMNVAIDSVRNKIHVDEGEVYNANASLFDIKSTTNRNHIDHGNSNQTDSEAQSNQSNAKPWFILHVGPGKTGTSHIQDFMFTSEIVNLLHKDHYSLIPYKLIHNNTNQQLAKPGSTMKFELIDEFVETVKNYRNIPGQNVFGSSEYLGTSTTSEMCEVWKHIFMEEQDWNLKIVVGYRRLHDKLPSLYNQQYKRFRGVNGTIIGETHEDWPGINGDYRIPSFEDYFLDTYSEFYPKKTHRSDYEIILSNWDNCSDEFEIFDTYESKVMLDDGRVVDGSNEMALNFICSSLKGVNHTCSKLLEKRRKLSDNRSVNLDYDILAVHAYESGLISKDLKRQEVAEKIESHVKEENITLAQKCPSQDVLDYIYEWSLEVEQWIKKRTKFSNGDNFSPSQLSSFNVDWEEIVAHEVLCTVDSDKLIKEAKWIKFFKGMKRSRV